MAEINVERKGPSLWPWILGLLTLALLIWALTSFFDRAPEVDDAPLAEPAAAPAGSG